MEASPKQYGDTRVDGNGVVHLGDRHIVNYYRIERAFLPSNDESTQIDSDLYGAPKRSRNNDYKRRLANQGRMMRQLRSALQDVKLEGQAAGIGISHLDQAQKQFLSTAASAGQTILPSAAASSQDRNIALQYIDWLTRRLTSVLRLPLMPDMASTTKATSPHQIIHQNLVPPQQKVAPQSRDQLDFLLLCFVLVSFITGRNVSMEELVRFLTKCSNDSLLLPVTFLLGMGVHQYLCVGGLHRRVSQVGGDYILLEDAFAVEIMVPWSVCEDFSILKAFLNVHYRGSPAELLIKYGHYNMMFNSRNGHIIRPGEWLEKRGIKAAHRIVMAVYLRSEGGTCTTCGLELLEMGRGELRCDSCDRFYRDLGALQHLVDAMGLSDGRYPDRSVALGRWSELYDGRTYLDLHKGLRMPALKHVDLWFKDSVEAVQLMPQPIGEPDSSSPPILNDALHYLDLLRDTLWDRPDLYNRFLDVMKDFKSRRIDTLGVIERVKEMLGGYPVLMSKFNTFLPPGYKLPCRLEGCSCRSMMKEDELAGHFDYGDDYGGDYGDNFGDDHDDHYGDDSEDGTQSGEDNGRHPEDAADPDTDFDAPELLPGTSETSGSD
ncbi:Transcriptional regulatory protein sin3 [Knufia obscura]|uniref:Transcriptional regulatory protein sin3 n=1 Tax=Knufia obscura TaxID=1635080 RepID=A0ABR0RQA0_9EURO|nr:Transcriptional regulatory protein sin3 [Knufia obscura]